MSIICDECDRALEERDLNEIVLSHSSRRIPPYMLLDYVLSATCSDCSPDGEPRVVLDRRLTNSEDNE